VSLLAVVLTICVAIPVTPSLRHYVVALVNDPNSLQAAKSDRRVHFEEGAKTCALEVAALLQTAIELVETKQGRPFRREPVIGVYSSYAHYARANGLENTNILATSRSGRVILSPALCENQHDLVAGVLAHELSHVHLFGWRSSLLSDRPPSWFTEGLAVMVSNGGAAEGVTELDAVAAIKRGDEIVVADQGAWTDLAAIPFHGDMKPSLAKDGLSRQRLAYRQAGMFVAWLQRSDPLAFAGLLTRLENGDPFGESFFSAFGKGPALQWKRFAEDVSRAP
jgi:hypothetical protein